MTPEVAIVTGAAGLIGREIAGALRVGGTQVDGWDREPGDDPPVVAVDINDRQQVLGAVADVEHRHGRLDAFVHAAAMTGRTARRDIVAPLADIDLDLWHETLHTNLTSALVCVQAVLPLLRRSSDPAVVLIGSIQGLVPTLETGAYSASKTALAGLARQLAAELAPEGITVNVVSPGPTIESSDPAARDRTGDGVPTPIGRFGRADEVAAVVAAVVGPGFRNVTGAVIPVDGGEHLRPRGAPHELSPTFFTPSEDLT